SYLFLNTFVYPIFGQYPDVPTALAQDPGSAIVQHRHALFDAAAPGIELVISVGEAAQASIATWRQAHGGTLPGGAIEVPVVHPGAAPKGGEAAVRASFAAAVKAVTDRRANHAGWLAPDPDGQPRSAQSYHLGSAPVPFRDLPFGVPWRLGRGG